ncbi:winged helix-turn-helix domain-containing protein [Pseudochryseolinea flava]|uniref:ModE family transcriptional regulator n=1 Tax=Pseudochryseolinea flava TaxID=2059302 RepID=A0A364Y0U0_9BACT|nr:LysR family transcriptional regulator [Pseudochryseolinea flava]RAW00201.1 ModE family transcriptional regulator [Pseudochryseolinea flava]
MAKQKHKQFRLRLWVDVNDEKLFGPGRAELLQLIDETGSIAKAAKSMGMSYKKAWAMVDEMNAKAKAPYVVPQKGGTQGGGTELTAEGKAVVKAYQKILSKLNATLEKEASFLDLV